MFYGIQNCPMEWTYRSGKAYADPFNDVTLDLLVTDPSGLQQRVPAFWAGDQSWRVRYASPYLGRHHYVTDCSDPRNESLHGQEGALEVAPYTGDNPLYRHGPVRVAPDRRYLEHADRTPFFWLGDTWWMSLCRRLHWPDEFRLLVADRVAKGFSVIQIVAGLYPDMPPFDERGANEAGFPWQSDYSRINPEYFDAADLRLDALVGAGLLPCIVGCWGYFVHWMGIERMKRHWRNLIARYGAYPVVWCVAGEAAMPYYLSEDKEGDHVFQQDAWTQLAAYVRATDPYHRPITSHPSCPASSRDDLTDPSAVDLSMLQTGHWDRDSLGPTVECVTRELNRTPRMPVINAEVCYEGIMEASREEVQRMMFWVSMLSGAVGFTYGANGLWQLNRRDQPYGPSPHGFSWGLTTWDEAYQLPGSTQVGLGKRLLERYPWWQFEPHPEWCTPHAGGDNYFLPYASGIPGKVRVIYFPWGTGFMWHSQTFHIRQLEPGARYQASFYNPVNGSEHPRGVATADAEGAWQIPSPPGFQDWILALDNMN